MLEFLKNLFDMSEVEDGDQGENPFSKLSYEMYVEIFEKLDPESLKKASRVCRKWNTAISTSAATMKKFKLRIGGNHIWSCNVWTTKYDNFMGLERKHVSVEIFVENFYEEYIVKDELGRFRPPKLARVIEFFKQFGPHIQELKLTNLTVDPLALREILESVPGLRSLDLGINIVLKQNLAENPPLVMKKLKHISFSSANVPYGFHWEIFETIIAPCLKTIDIASCIGTLNLIKFQSFLAASPQLDTIKMNKDCFLKSFGQIESGVSFKIRHLSVDLGNCTLVVDKERRNRFHRFINRHRLTIESLHIRAADLGHNEIDFRNFRCLRCLSISLGTSYKPGHSYETRFFKCGRSVEYNGAFTDMNMARNHLVSPLQLLTLRVMRDPNVPHLLNSLTVSNPLLAYMGIHTIYRSNAVFHNLRTLELAHIRDCEDFRHFIKNNPTIESVIIYSFELFDKIIDDILDHPGIKKLRFYARRRQLTTAMRPIYNVIKENYGNLQDKLSLIEIRPIYLSEPKPSIVFQFPEDHQDLKLNLKKMRKYSEGNIHSGILSYILPFW